MSETKKAYRFELGYKNGTRFEVAHSETEAIEKAKSLFESYGTEAPEFWVVAQWSIDY
jgi:hypothetical protein